MSPRTSRAVMLLLSGDALPPDLTHLELDYDRRDLQGLLVGPLAAPTVTPLLPLSQLQVCIVLVSADCHKQTAFKCKLHNLQLIVWQELQAATP